jgi:hypothetical protein
LPAPLAPGEAIAAIGAGFGPDAQLLVDGVPLTGASVTETTLSGPYAVTALAPSVFVGGFYADGIAAVVGPVAGLPGNVYQISVYVPNPASLNPDLRNNPIPPQQGVTLVMGPVNSSNFEGSSMISQPGLILNVKP